MYKVNTTITRRGVATTSEPSRDFYFYTYIYFYTYAYTHHYKFIDLTPWLPNEETEGRDQTQRGQASEQPTSERERPQNTELARAE